MPRKPIPPPLHLNAHEVPITERYEMPFLLADQPRLFLNMLANHSMLPERYRDLIAQWLHAYNDELATFFIERYGVEAAQEATMLSIAQYEHMIDEMAKGREAADGELFDHLGQELFRDE